jgi:hypothetical protein
MKIRYLQLHKNLNLPGQPAQLKKLNANGLDREMNGAVRQIVRAPHGFIIEIPAGHHKGFYEIPAESVEHARLEPENEEEAWEMRGVTGVTPVVLAEAQKLVQLDPKLTITAAVRLVMFPPAPPAPPADDAQKTAEAPTQKKPKTPKA